MASALDSHALGGTATMPPAAALALSTDGPMTSHDAQPSYAEDLSPHDTASSTMSPSSVHSPPYWLNSGHQRTVSSLSADSVLPAGAITLRDNETSEHDDRNNACWARGVVVDDYTIVNGSATNIGAFVVWIIKVETLSVSAVPRGSCIARELTVRREAT